MSSTPRFELGATVAMRNGRKFAVIGVPASYEGRGSDYYEIQNADGRRMFRLERDLKPAS